MPNLLAQHYANGLWTLTEAKTGRVIAWSKERFFGVSLCDIIKAYESGMSRDRLALESGLPRRIVLKRLKDAGVRLRGRSEAAYCRSPSRVRVV